MRRSDALYGTLMNQTVLAEFFKPALIALGKVRYSNERFKSLPMEVFCLLGCLRHMRSVSTMREQIQQLFHLAESDQMPVPRSTYSDALNSPVRAGVLQSTLTALVGIARQALPDRLSDIKALGNRPIFAFDGSYQKESAHYKRTTPKNGGDDNHKGHMMLTAFDVRMGIPVDVAIETTNSHETRVLTDNFDVEGGCLRQRNAIFVVDRAFVNMPLWDRHKKRYGQTSITRWKENLTAHSFVGRDVKETAVNEGVQADEDIQLNASAQPWRRITYRTPEGNDLVFLTNELTLDPGIIVFLYLRRWDEEKCFDTWKNDFSCQKAWSKSINGILQQALLAVVTTILVHLFSQHHKTEFGIDDEKSLNKQDDLIRKKAAEIDQRIPWYRKFFRAAAKISRQIIRFLKECFLKKHSQKLYERELKPLYLKWL